MAKSSRLPLDVVLGAALASALLAQSGGGGSAKPPGSASPSTRTTTPPSASQPSAGASNDARRLIYLTGLVMLDDGSPPPEAVTIEISCRGRAKPYGVTDSRGIFSVNYGEPDPYASADSSYSGQQPRSTAASGLSKQGSANPLMGCELSARLPGFRSDPIQLGERSQLDNPSLGSIILHRLANVNGYTFSMTTMNAPNGAQKDYEKGLEFARKAKWPEAEARFRKAVDAYPKYAVCWEALGRTLEVQKRLPDDAQRAYEQSIQADPRFVTPHLRLMVLFGSAQRWEEVAKSAATIVQLDPYSYPIAYYFGGIANRILKRPDVAERDVRAGLNVDSHGTVPRLNHLMGTLLMERRAYAEALPYLKAYLENEPASNDTEQVKGAIAFAEKMADMPGHDAPEP